MARNGFRGFNTNFAQVEIGQTLPTGFTFDGTIFRTGGQSLKFVATSGASSTVGLPGVGPWARIYIRVTTLPATARQLIGSSGTGHNIRLNPDGTLGFYSINSLLGTSATTLTDTSKFYRVEWMFSTSAVSQVRLRVDGVDEVTTGSNAGGNSSIGANDTVAATFTMYLADYSSDDAAFPGDGKVVRLAPISDNARAALWTGGAGGTTNLFDAVNNEPPTGTATETDATQIEHAGGAAGSTDDYAANMTTYATAGIGASDTINAVQAVVVHGEDIITGTKLLTFSIASNPAQGAFETNFSAGADVGALGTYPTNWTLTRGTIITNPSVTVGTSPVMKVRRPETASRVASVCFMGMYVDYTPAVVAASYPRLQPRAAFGHIGTM